MKRETVLVVLVGLFLLLLFVVGVASDVVATVTLPVGRRVSPVPNRDRTDSPRVTLLAGPSVCERR